MVYLSHVHQSKTARFAWNGRIKSCLGSWWSTKMVACGPTINHFWIRLISVRSQTWMDTTLSKLSIKRRRRSGRPTRTRRTMLTWTGLCGWSSARNDPLIKSWKTSSQTISSKWCVFETLSNSEEWTLKLPRCSAIVSIPASMERATSHLIRLGRLVETKLRTTLVNRWSDQWPARTNQLISSNNSSMKG